MNRCTLGLATLLVSFGLLSAEEYNSKIVKVTNEGDTKEITIQIEGKDVVIPVDKTATFHRKGKGTKEPELPDGLKSVKAGATATVTTDKRDGVEVVTKVVLGGGKK